MSCLQSFMICGDRKMVKGTLMTHDTSVNRRCTSPGSCPPYCPFWLCCQGSAWPGLSTSSTLKHTAGTAGTAGTQEKISPCNVSVWLYFHLCFHLCSMLVVWNPWNESMVSVSTESPSSPALLGIVRNRVCTPLHSSHQLTAHAERSFHGSFHGSLHGSFHVVSVQTFWQYSSLLGAFWLQMARPWKRKKH